MKPATTKKKIAKAVRATRSTSPSRPSKSPSKSSAARRGSRSAAAIRPAPVAKPRPASRRAAPSMPAKQREFFRKLLLERKQRLAEAYNTNKTYGRYTEDEGTQDLADKASNAYTKEFLYSLSNTDREVLKKVDLALARLDRGGYGECIECGTEINRKRLEAVPWAIHCIDCQEKIEKGLL